MQKSKLHWLIAAIILALLLILQRTIKDTSVDKRQLLLDAATEGNKQQVQQLIAEGVDPNYQGVAYGSALLYAAGNGHVEIVRFLIEKGANVNIRNGFDSTPLISAASKGHHEIVQLLIEKGADISLREVTEDNAYKVALKNGHINTAAVIAKYCPTQKCD